MIVKSALMQIRAEGDKQRLIEKHLGLLAQAAQQGVHISCFGELAFSLYFPQVMDKRWFSLAEPIPGPTTAVMQEAARKHNMVLIVPLFETAGSGLYYNSAAVIDADGALLGTYRKSHIPCAPHGLEKFYFKPGNLGYPVFQTAYGKIGMLICYDRQFPEAARILGLRGAEMVFVPAATFRGRVDHLWFIGSRSHAASNAYFVGTLNRVGVEELGPAQFFGSSYFCDPQANIIAQASEDKEEILVADLDLDQIAEERTTRYFFRDRRPETYEELSRLLP